MESREDELAAACDQWQSGRDGGSTPLRGAARVVTKVPHYFAAEFITAQEDKARCNVQSVNRAMSLLRAVEASPLRTADEWNRELGLAERGFVGRGLPPKPPYDEQILIQLHAGRISMPLWGVSLNPEVADHYGRVGGISAPRFLFVIDGPFPAVPAWVHSGALPEEEELICGGDYEVVSTKDNGATTVAVLRFGRHLHSG